MADIFDEPISFFGLRMRAYTNGTYVISIEATQDHHDAGDETVTK